MRLETSITALLFCFISHGAISAGVLTNPEFKDCADQYQATRKLTSECDDLWHKIEKRLTDVTDEKVAAIYCGQFPSKRSTAQCERKRDAYKQCLYKDLNDGSLCEQMAKSFDDDLKREHESFKFIAMLHNPKNRSILQKRMLLAVAQGKKSAAENLKDPDSVKFRNLHVSKDTLSLCGELNAKNSYGGYVGFRRFFSIWELGHASIDKSDDNSDYGFNQSWEDNCADTKG